MMKDKEQTGGLDCFKIIAALLVVAIHTSPLASFSAEADFLLTRVFARVAVPFFLMVTGYFVLPEYVFGKTDRFDRLRQCLRKILLLYAVSILLYLPVNIYAGHFRGADLWDILRMLLFDGTLYHLWYLPAVILGILLVYALSRRLSFQYVFAISALLYFCGLLGDSYYGLIRSVPTIASVYDAGFHIFSYTRNGLFYVPVFLSLGAWIRKCGRSKVWYVDLLGFALSMTAMSFEGIILHRRGLPRHDSMYIFLLPCMFFLFRLILSWNVRPPKFLREVSTCIYILHPMMIVAVRGAAKLTGLNGLLIDCSLLHYLCVCTGACVFAGIICWVHSLCKNDVDPTGRAWIELDMDKLRHNVEVLQKMLPHGCELMPAVKANAYGHGSVPIARELNRLGIRSFCVASIEEGIELRKHGIKGEILVLGYTHPAQFSLLRRYHLTQTVIDYAYALTLNNYGHRMKAHIGIDTGMHRLGERCESIDQILDIFRMKNISVTGIYTHLCADDCDEAESRAFTAEQERQFRDLIHKLHEHGYGPKTHILSSYGLLKYPEYGGDYARVGIALYGVLSTGEDAHTCSAKLCPILSLKARVASVRTLKPGEHAGYGLEFTARSEVTIAALSIGYADGLPRALSCGIGAVLINGYKVPIIGHICMDQTLVDVSAVPKARQGDTAILIGADGEESISAYDIAAQSGTITNEILSSLGQRLHIVEK
ncbi:MAG: serine racemase VanT catalytic subunit [Oscillospiraceae bacterium]